MPAREHAFSDALPARLYLDVDIAIEVLVESEPHHLRCREFIERLTSHGTRLFVSPLLWLEFLNAVSREAFRQRLSDEFCGRYRLERWQRPITRQVYLDEMVHRLDDLIGHFEWFEVGLTPAIRAEAYNHVTNFNLRPIDAAHLATARSVGVNEIASLDEAFRRVNDLELWNDLVHDRLT